MLIEAWHFDGGRLGLEASIQQRWVLFRSLAVLRQLQAAHASSLDLFALNFLCTRISDSRSLKHEASTPLQILDSTVQALTDAGLLVVNLVSMRRFDK